MKYPLNVKERIGLVVVAVIVAANLCWVMCVRQSERERASEVVPAPAVYVVSEQQDTLALRNERKASKRRNSRKAKSRKSKRKESSGASVQPESPSRQWTEEEVPSSSR